MFDKTRLQQLVAINLKIFPKKEKGWGKLLSYFQIWSYNE